MEENNKIIAEFMGFTFEKNIGYYDNEMLLEQIVYEQQNGNCFDELLFNKDWNWLMAVVEKIESLNYELFIETFEIRIEKFNEVLFRQHTKILNQSKIQTVYNICVEFINFYNKQKEE
jgi:hypothetical protein